MITYNRVSDDQSTFFYKNVSNETLSVKIKVYESYTNALVYEDNLDLKPNIEYYTYTSPSWKNKFVKIYNQTNNELLLPLVIEGKLNLEDYDQYGYIKKVCNLEKEEIKKSAIVEICTEHFVERKYRDFCDIEKGDIVVDIGFNYGIFSLGALYKGASKIYGFEPNKDIFNLIKDVYPYEGKVQLYNVAIGDKNTKLILKPTENTLGSSILDEVNYGMDKSYEVQCFNFFDFVTLHQINKIDLLKVDCEGAEYQIFETIPDEYFSKIGKINVEFHFNDGIKVKQLIDKLNRNGFDWKFEPNKSEESWIGLIFARNRNK